MSGAVKGGANGYWNTRNESNAAPTVEHCVLEVLMDIRRELSSVNRLLNCSNAVRIPHVLDQIQKNTKKPKRRKRT